MRDLFLKNPWVRALVPLLLMGIASLSGNLLASEISAGSTVAWSAIPSSAAFYMFLAATVTLCAYEVKISQHDRSLAKGFTAKQYEAAIRNKVAEDIANRSKKLIKDGNVEQLEKETEIFSKLYGGGN